ncbi:MAG: hypothetical protein ACLUKQ_05910 [Peptococcaceae bacterium]
MKTKKWLTIITFVVSLLSIIVAFNISKENNSIFYDIAMALFGSASLGFIMSIIEYYVERRKAMEEFWLQATKVLKELRKIKYLDEDAPLNLIIDAFNEEYSNKCNQVFAILSGDKEIHHEAKNKLISWYEENIPFSFDENTDIDKELEQFYESEMAEYEKSFTQCMDSYQTASTIELGILDNAYGNLDFIFANKCVRQETYDQIFNKLRNIIFQFRTESHHFNILKDGKGNFPVCASKVCVLNQKYFSSKEEEVHGVTNTLIFQSIFDDIDASLEEFRCKIYGTKYVAPKKEPIFGKMIFFGDNEE